jgi:hypothetical protein
VSPPLAKEDLTNLYGSLSQDSNYDKSSLAYDDWSGSKHEEQKTCHLKWEL